MTAITVYVCDICDGEYQSSSVIGVHENKITLAPCNGDKHICKPCARILKDQLNNCFEVPTID